MLDKIKHIKAGDKEYPIAFTLNVVETIQDVYGSLDKWSNKLQPEEGKEPQLKDVIWTFEQFINEGIDIENEDKDEKRAFLTHKQVGRVITEIGFKESGSMIRDLTVDSISTGEEEKNSTTQQNQV